MKKNVMIVAGGSGSRMNASIPKQFIPIHGLPLLMHTLNAFYRYDQEIRIIVVLPESHIQTWKSLCKTYNFLIHHELRPGGITRFHSVKKNLDLITDDVLIGIHDGVRPLVDLETIERCFAAALKYGNAVPAVSIPETLRRITPEGSEIVDRNLYRLIQTPQVFVGKLLKKAYLQEYNENFTDDAGVVEQLHEVPIHIVEGNSDNIKITYSGDIQIAEALLHAR